MRSEMWVLQKVRVWNDLFEIFDINGDTFEVRGIGYPDKDITPPSPLIWQNKNPKSPRS